MVGIQSDFIYSIIENIVELEKEIKEKKYIINESTIRNQFFHKLQDEYEDIYALSSEVNIKKIAKTKLAGFFDFYARHLSSKNHRKNVAFEFKVNCNNLSLIKKDLQKLEKFSKNHRRAEGIFINFFTKPLNFNEYYKKIIKKIKTKAIYLFVFPSVKGFYYKNKKDNVINHFEMSNITLISNSIKASFHPEKIKNKEGIIINIRIPDNKRSTLNRPKLSFSGKNDSFKEIKFYEIKK